MNEVDKILSGPDQFTCDRMKCTMKKTDCIANQKRASVDVDVSHGDYKPNNSRYRCKRCEQGKRIAEVEKMKGDAVPIKKDNINKIPDLQGKITLDFIDHGYLLVFVKGEAKEEFRSIKGQIMAIIRDRYKNVNMDDKK